jgi:hypothetical protein
VDAFSYLSVLLSIILGLGFTQLFAAAGRLIRHRDRVRVHWLPLLWAAVLVLIYVQVWWSMYGLRLYSDWTFLAFGAVLAQAAALYLMAAVVLPEFVDEAGVDLGAYFDAQHRWFFGFFLLLLCISIVKDLILSGHLPDTMNLGFHGVLALVCFAGLVVRKRTGQVVLAMCAALVIMAYIWLLFARLR